MHIMFNNPLVYVVEYSGLEAVEVIDKRVGRGALIRDDAAADWHDAWAFRHGDLPHANTVGLHGADWPDRPYCCDFAFVTAALRPRLREVGIDRITDASDHQPLWVELGD